MSSYVTRKTPGDTAWFTRDRFGMFIHWGLYAMPARHEWVKTRERIPGGEVRQVFRSILIPTCSTRGNGRVRRRPPA